MKERVWIAADLAREPLLDRYSTARNWVELEAAAGRLHLKLRRASWGRLQGRFPMHRKWWSLTEARALERFRSAGIPAVEARLAGAEVGAQSGEAFLATRAYLGHDLQHALRHDQAAEDWPFALGTLAAQLHAAALVHRDFYLRNVLAVAGRLLLLDAHRSQRLRAFRWSHPRGRAYDLACMDLDLLALSSSADRNLFWASYLSQVPGAPASAKLQRWVERSKRGLCARFERKSAESRSARASQLGLSEAELRERWSRG